MVASWVPWSGTWPDGHTTYTKLVIETCHKAQLAMDDMVTHNYIVVISSFHGCKKGDFPAYGMGLINYAI